MPRHDTRLEIRLPGLLRAQLEAQAAGRGWTAAMYAREAIRERLRAELEDRRREPGSTVTQAG